MKYRKLPVEIEALQWTGDNFEEVKQFVGQEVHLLDEERLLLRTLEGLVVASKTDFIVCGVDGEFYPCKESVFCKTYKKVEN